MLLSAPIVSQANDCDSLSKPKTMNIDNAMKQIFCYYHIENQATLLPLESTQNWQIENANTILQPQSLDFFNNQNSASLLVARRKIDNGEIYKLDRYKGASFSIYVFERQQGQWQFLKGKKMVLETGMRGNIPKSVFLSEQDESGYVITNSDYCQFGYCSQKAFYVSLTPKQPKMMGDFSVYYQNMYVSEEPVFLDAELISVNNKVLLKNNYRRFDINNETQEDESYQVFQCYDIHAEEFGQLVSCD